MADSFGRRRTSLVAQPLVERADREREPAFGFGFFHGEDLDEFAVGLEDLLEPEARVVGDAVADEGGEQGVAFHEAGMGHTPQDAQDLAADVFVAGPFAVGRRFLAQDRVGAGWGRAALGVADELGQQRQPIHGEAFSGRRVHEFAHDGQPERPFAD